MAVGNHIYGCRGGGEFKKKKANSTRVILGQESPQQQSYWHHRRRDAILPVTFFSPAQSFQRLLPRLRRWRKKKKNTSTHYIQLHHSLSQSILGRKLRNESELQLLGSLVSDSPECPGRKQREKLSDWPSQSASAGRRHGGGRGRGMESRREEMLSACH